jgi:uncharacterized membrane protein YedE/YeeE
MSDFTPLAGLAGGALIGLAATLLLWVNGRVAGVSSMIAGLVLPVRGDNAWRGVFLGALVAAGALGALLSPASLGSSPASLPVLALSGVLVGIGTRLANGCTSGHGVCGVSRLSPRSLAATATFVAVGMLTVFAVRWLGLRP